MLGRVEGNKLSLLFTALLLKCQALHVPSNKAVNHTVSSSTALKTEQPHLLSCHQASQEHPHSLLHVLPSDVNLS